MRDHEISQRRACQLVGVDPKTVRRPRPPDCPEIRKEMQEIAGKRRRFGYRRIGILLERKGMIMNHKKLYRLYREEGLTVRKRGGCKRAIGTRAPMAIPQGPNQRWSLDFVSDSFADGRRFRVLCVIDDFTRECLAAVVDTSLSGLRVARELDRIAELRGYPCMVVSERAIVRHRSEDNGERHGVDQQCDPEMAGGPQGGMALHRAGKANAERSRRARTGGATPLAVESFNGRLRDECLNEHLFSNRRPLCSDQWRINGRPCPPADRGMAGRLQPPPPPYEPRRADAPRVSPTGRKRPNPEQS